jgi:phosphatidylserine/phosphatidylglycerophosphate/cardiolipin synthase-like enzyme
MRAYRFKIFGLMLAFLIIISVIPLFVPMQAPGSEIRLSATESKGHPWQTFSRNMNVTTFVSPDGSKDELWHFLNSAQQSIYVEIYGINNPYILDLIHQIDTAKPGLDMKFLIGWNSLGYPDQNKYVANNLTLLGYEVKWTSASDFTYAHQKYIIIDNETTIIHAGNWAKTSFPESGMKANREWSIAMTDTQVTSYYRTVFDGDWKNGTVYDAGTHGTGTPLTYTETSSTYTRPFATAGEFSGPMNVTPILSPDTSLQGILQCINIAQATLDIQIPYFTSVGDAGEVDQIIDAILAAKARGVTVRVITEEDKDWEEIEQILTDNDISIVWQDTRWFSANHNKGIIVDGRIVLISSINYSDGSISENREAGVIIENEQVAQWYQEVYDFDWGLADCDAMDDVNVYWEPNIPKSTSVINVTVYAHMIYPDVDEVELDIRVGSGPWSNVTITSNVYNSDEDDLENYFYVIPSQADGSNITVVARIKEGSTWHVGLPMVIRVRDSIGSVITTTTPTTTTPPIPGFPLEAIFIALMLVVIPVLVLRRKRNQST